MSEPTEQPPRTATSSPTASPSIGRPLDQRKPRISLALATVLGLGYLPKAPGTWGSLAGVALGWSAMVFSVSRLAPPAVGRTWDNSATWWSNFAWTECGLVVVVSLIGVWAASQAAKYLKKKDPQIVVIDEVSGQLIAYLGLATPKTFSLNWKYLLLGFILFRVFDIWKPFPARQAESLPGGLGIMADDWVAGIYAALGLWIARAAGL
jgi:phosphatidylglycerophosphatase A